MSLINCPGLRLRPSVCSCLEGEGEALYCRCSLAPASPAAATPRPSHSRLTLSDMSLTSRETFLSEWSGGLLPGVSGLLLLRLPDTEHGVLPRRRRRPPDASREPPCAVTGGALPRRRGARDGLAGSVIGESSRAVPCRPDLPQDAAVPCLCRRSHTVSCRGPPAFEPGSPATSAARSQSPFAMHVVSMCESASSGPSVRPLICEQVAQR